MTALPVPAARRQLAPLDQLAAIPEEEIWLAKQKSKQTRRAYQLDVRHFMRALGITSTDALRQVDHRAVIAWERMQREQEGATASTVRRRLAALSSLFKHLVRHGAAAVIPSSTWTGRRSIATRAARPRSRKSRRARLLDAPPADTLAGLRDRAILSVGLQVGFRRAEIAALNVGDLHQNRGFDALRVIRKGGRREALAINPQAAQRIRAYLENAGHGDQHRRAAVPSAARQQKALDAADRVQVAIRLWGGAVRCQPPRDEGCGEHQVPRGSSRISVIGSAGQNGEALPRNDPEPLPALSRGRGRRQLQRQQRRVVGGNLLGGGFRNVPPPQVVRGQMPEHVVQQG